MFVCIAWACLAGMPSARGANGNSGDWELDKPEYRDFAALPDSKLMRETLALPLDEDLYSAEIARVDLAIMRQPEYASLLRAWMEYDVAASVLGLAAHRADSVGEAIAQQRAAPATVDAAQRNALYRAVAAANPHASAQGGVLLPSKHAYVLPDGGMSFGYPANADGAARNVAHARLFASSCLDRGTCSRLSYFLQRPATRHGLSFALTVAIWLALAAALIAFALMAPGPLVYPLFVAGVPLLVFTVLISYGGHDSMSGLVSILFAAIYGVPVGLACALTAALLRYAARKRRAARIAAVDAQERSS